jgi:predicted enzyme related to lactoylglutathione lyase
MAEMNEYPHGTFCWVDLAAKDAAVAKDFYTRLFGWTAIDAPAGDHGVYTMLQKNGKDVCALFGMSDQMCEQGVPTHWQSYVSVDDVDGTAKKVEELGGTVLQPPFDVMEAGRMTIIRDPDGASVALWQGNQHAGAKLVNEPGSFCWNELYARNVEREREFYTKLLGWTFDVMPDSAGDEYTVFKSGERAAGGMMEIKKEWGEVPPNWSVYFTVEDCDATVESATGMGASTVMPTMDIENVGRFTFLKDPQGAYFAVIQLKEAATTA